MDRRQKKTQRAIFTAMNQLLLRKRYDKITIMDILQEADISRSTFYDHFTCKDELIKRMNEALFQHVFTSPLTTEASHDFSKEHRDLHTFLTHTLYHLKEEYDNVKGILDSDSSQLFWQYLQEQFNMTVSPIIYSERMAVQIPRQIWEKHVAMTFVELVKWWFKQGREEAPEQIEHYFELLILPVMRQEALCEIPAHI